METLNPQNFIKVGKVQSTQGLKGEVFVLVFSGEFPWKNKIKNIYLGPKDGDGPLQAFAVERLRPHNKQKHVGLAIKIKDKNRIEDVQPLIGRPFFIPGDLLTSESGEAIYLREIQGFQVVDKSRGQVGVVKDFLDNGAQDLIVVSHSSGEDFEVPLVEPLLESIDFQKKIIFMDIPQGLVAGEDL